jgi:hypothetical protein
MSYYLINLEKDISDFDVDNIIIDKKIEIEKDNSKYLFYYLNEEIPKEIYIKLPKIRLTNDWTYLKYNQLKIRITPKYDKTDKIAELIESIEEKIKKSKIFNKKKWEFISMITTESSDFIKTFFQENKTKITTNLKRPSIKLTDFKNNGEIQMVIKINNIWQKGNKFGLSSQLYQVKYFAPPEDLDLNFIDKEDFVPKNINIPQLPPQSFNPLTHSSFNKTTEQPSIPITRPMISSQLLQSIKLKSIKN